MKVTEHIKYMLLALDEARLALDRGDRPIGCVIVHRDQVISRGSNTVRTTNCELDHAEMVAIREGADYLDTHAVDCILYTTLEPCTMCLGAIAATGIGRVFFGEADPERGGTEAHMRVTFVRINVDSYHRGVLAKECAELRLHGRRVACEAQRRCS